MILRIKGGTALIVPGMMHIHCIAVSIRMQKKPLQNVSQIRTGPYWKKKTDAETVQRKLKCAESPGYVISEVTGKKT